MQTVDVVHDSPLPPARAYALLAEHENLGPLLGATVRRVRDGRTSRNGAGSARSIRVAVLPPFEEEVTTAEPDSLLEYRITRGSPLRGHRGRITFAPLGSGTRIRWQITFDAAVPGLARVVALGLQRGIAKGLQTMDRQAADGPATDGPASGGQA